MASFADLLANRTHSRVLLPTHPGFGGTPRPDSFNSVIDLARAYVELLEQLDLADVTLIGNSFGGWLAAEIALLESPRVSGAVIVDAIGIQVAEQPITDVSRLSPNELAALFFHDPSRAPTRAATGGTAPSPDLKALASYAGPTMFDPSLRERLGAIDELLALYDADGQTPTELCRAVGVEPGTMTKTLQRMERDGLVERRRSPTDGRSVTVHLTERARHLESVLKDAAARVNAHVSRPLSDRQA